MSLPLRVPLRLLLILLFAVSCAPTPSGAGSVTAPPPGPLPTAAAPLADAELVPTAAQIRELRTHPGYATEPFLVTNLLAFTGESGRMTYYQEYGPRAVEVIRTQGGVLVSAGPIAAVFAASGDAAWEDMVQVWWPSRSAFVTAMESPDYAPLRRARASGLARTAMLLTTPPMRLEPPAPDSAAAAAAVGAATQAWLQAYERGDADALAALFTEEGIYAANTGQLLRGRAAIRDGVRGWAAAQRGILSSLGLTEVTGIDVAAEVVRFRRAGDAAYSLSRFLIRVEPAGCVLDAGHSLAVWQIQPDGEWRIESLVVNQDREPPPGACARR